MVGNEVYEDAVAATSVGMKAFLITEYLINRKDIDISQFPHGDFNDLIVYIDKLNQGD